ncbi:MAG: TerD family protein [Clostridiales Family XIII bacterium]|nr:TerD family protein [Clostridiales Family XIII bacterium]
MSINLQKGQRLDLTKGNAGLKTLIVGLGWDEAAQPSKGLLGGLLGGAKQEIDCDASAILLTNGKLRGNKDLVYFGNLKHTSGSVVHQGDNLTGAGEGDDEQIKVFLDKVPADCDKIVFVVTIYKAVQRRQHFGMISNAFIRIVDAQTGQELMKYNLSENYNNMTAMIFGEVYRNNGEWKFSAIGQATSDPGLAELAGRYV